MDPREELAALRRLAELEAKAAAAPASVRAGSALREIPRQIGLTARYALEGFPQAVDVLASPFRIAINKGAEALGAQARAGTLSGLGTSLADGMGLPSPQSPNERVIGDAARTMASVGGMSSGANALAGVTEGVGRNVLQSLAAKPAAQMVGGATSGAAGGAVREAGGGAFEQFTASLLGGVGGGLTADKLGNAANWAGRAAKRAITPAAVEQANADKQISLILERQGIDWAAVPERIKQSMRADVGAAMSSGQPLNADALRRLLVFRRANIQPTVGQLTQDPGLITREKNLSKVAANSTDPSLQRLPMLENQNVQSLLRQLDEVGAAKAASPIDAGRVGIEALDSVVGRETGNINSLYRAARDTQGRSLPLEGGTFTRLANQALDEANVGSFLPQDIAKKMNAIAKGEIPLTVDVSEQLKTSIGNLQRNSNDGNVRAALGIVRKALDQAPLQNSKTWNPGNTPAVFGTVPPSTASIGEESIAAFGAARTANRQWMQRVESNPALKAVVDGVEPDQFVQKFLVGKGATVADVRKLKGDLPPQAIDTMRNYLVGHLKSAATNNTDDVAKFSSAGYNKALNDLGEKLGVFFDAEEVQRLRDFGAAAKYMQAQPAGSAVNNSSSGALMLGKGLDMLDAFSQKVPLGLKDTLTGTIQGAQQQQILAPKNALAMPLVRQPQSPAILNPLFAGAIAPHPRKDDGRR